MKATKRMCGSTATFNLAGWCDGQTYTAAVPVDRSLPEVTTFYTGDGVRFVFRADTAVALARLVWATRDDYEPLRVVKRQFTQQVLAL